MPAEIITAHKDQDFVAPEDARLSPEKLHEVLEQNTRADEEKSLELAEKITKEMNEISNLHTQERILKEIGVPEQAQEKHDAAATKQSEVDGILQREGFVHDIQKLTSGEARQVLEAILQRMRALRLESETLNEAGTTYRDDRNVNGRAEFWAKIQPRIDRCEAEYQRLVPMKDAISTQIQEASLAEGIAYQKKNGTPGQLVNVGEIGRSGY